MEIREEVLWVIIGAAAVTFVPRVLPLAVFSRIRLPEWALRFLNYVPAAVMAALLAQALLTNSGQFIPLQHNVKLLAFVPTLLMAVVTRSLLGTVVAGILSITVLNLFF